MLYIGVTNNLRRRLSEHEANKGTNKTFAGKYFCYKLVYWERYFNPMSAIDREKQLKSWTRKKKEDLINTQNPDWRFLNEEI